MDSQNLLDKRAHPSVFSMDLETELTLPPFEVYDQNDPGSSVYLRDRDKMGSKVNSFLIGAQDVNHYISDRTMCQNSFLQSQRTHLNKVKVSLAPSDQRLLQQPASFKKPSAMSDKSGYMINSLSRDITSSINTESVVDMISVQESLPNSR